MITPNFSWRLGLFVIFGFWVLVALRGGFPPPFIDDAWYIGAAINLSEHGIFSNPLCESLKAVGSDHLFLASMPLHSYVLAGWLWLFGVSTVSLHIFYSLLALLDTLLIYRLLPKSRTSCLAAFYIVLAVYGLLAGVGLRQDSLGLLFLLAGLDIWREQTAIGFFEKSMFLGLSIITFPTVALTAILLFTAAIFYQWQFQGRTAKQLIPLALAGAIAYGLCFLILIFCIRGALSSFLESIHRNQQLGSEGVSLRFQLLTMLGISKWVIIQLAFVIFLGVLSYRARSHHHWKIYGFFIGLMALAFGCLAFASLNSATGAHFWAFMCLIVSLYVVMHEKWPWPAWSILAGLLVIGGFGHAHTAIQHVLADRPMDPRDREALRQKINQLQPRKVYLDAYAMQELFDYRLPPNAYCFETCSTTGWGAPTSVATMPVDSIAIVSVGQSFSTPLTPEAGKSGKPLKILGYPLSGLVKNPYQLEIIDNRN